MSPVVIRSPYPAAVATTAVAGVPGTFTPAGSPTPETGAEVEALVASPTTAWTIGQHVAAANGETRYWNSLKWAAGRAPIPTNLMLAYSFSEGAGQTVNDGSTRNSHAQLGSTAASGDADDPAWSALGHGLEFYGNQQMYVPTAVADSLWTGTVTVMVCAYLWSQRQHMFVGKNDGQWVNCPVEFRTNNVSPTRLTLVRATAANFREWYGPAVTINTWQVYSYTTTATFATAPIFYLNKVTSTGTLNQGTGTGTATGQNGTLRLGKRQDNAFFLEGVLGLVWAYNSVLSAAQIGQNYDVMKLIMAQRGATLP
jgi:hypothetical protein